MGIDYYQVLGVDRDASQDDIKRAFRRLARETHPDANPDDPQAEKRFREIAQAYEVLGDPQRRIAYDRGVSFDAGDLFSSFAGIDDLLSRFFGSAGFGFPFGAAPAGPATGADVTLGIEITLAEAAQGVQRQVEYKAATRCDACEGSGSDPSVDLEICDRCGGQGSLRMTRQTLLGTTMSIVPCDRCRGRGRVVVRPCPDCGGSGSTMAKRSVTVEVPAGIDNGARLRVAGRGAAGEPGGRSGDLLVEVRVLPDERFERHGSDLVHRVRLGLSEVALGTSVTVPTVDGGELEIDVPAGTQAGAVFRLSKQGMPRIRRRGRGDLLVEVRLEVPTKLSAKEQEALRRYASLRGEQPAEGRRIRRPRAR
jgi:molecular chaperone DnaJ